MIRRRRRAREIPFSFDSFVDIVANVLGIIIRLILVVWVGARSYSSVQEMAKPLSAPRAEAFGIERPEPLEQQLSAHRRELALAQERLLEELRQLQQSKAEEMLAQKQLTSLASRRRELEMESAGLVTTGSRQDVARTLALSSAEMRRRSQKLVEEIRTLDQLPPAKNALRYRTPISRPVQSEELLFECHNGRLTFIDIVALLGQVRQGMDEKGKLLRNSWEVSDVTSPVGAFRLRYTVERERGLLDALGEGAPAAGSGGFRYGVSEWQIEPVAFIRGEAAETALKAGSEFHQIVDAIDPQQTAVTFWVYPDSFELFRRLRDCLYVRDVVVAGRPLPEGVPIGSSRRGTVSRGQ
jgi:hypothetical protein